MMAMKGKLLFGVGIVALLNGCVGLSSDRYLANKKTFLLNHDNPPTYVEGYTDGCSAGRRLGGDKRFVYRKNQMRFEKDALYARGWQEGQINCRNEALTEEKHGVGSPKTSQDKKRLTQKEKEFQEAEKAAEKEMREIWEELKK